MNEADNSNSPVQKLIYPRPQFVVKAITDERFFHDILQYRVQWEGFPDEDSTWENENLLNCPEQIEKYKSKKEEEMSDEDFEEEDEEEEECQKRYFATFAQKKKKIPHYQIESAYKKKGTIFYHVIRPGSKPVDMSSRDVRIKCPDVLLSFLEKEVIFNDPIIFQKISRPNQFATTTKEIDGSSNSKEFTESLPLNNVTICPPFSVNEKHTDTSSPTLVTTQDKSKDIASNPSIQMPNLGNTVESLNETMQPENPIANSSLPNETLNIEIKNKPKDKNMKSKENKIKKSRAQRYTKMDLEKMLKSKISNSGSNHSISNKIKEPNQCPFIDSFGDFLKFKKLLYKKEYI